MHCCLSYETRQVLVEEPNRLNTELLSVELSICSYKLSMHIYLFNIPCLACLARRGLSIFWAAIFDTRVLRWGTQA